MINDKYMKYVDDAHKQAYLDYINGRPLEAYGSHQPLLINTLNTITKGNVLEFGMGYQSTPILHEICTRQKRNLISLECDGNWVEKFDNYKSQYHDIMWRTPQELLNFRYPHIAIAFIDGEPREYRQKLIDKLKDQVDYFIVHDTQEVFYDSYYLAQRSDVVFYGYNFSGFKHVFHLPMSIPSASLLTNIDNINIELLNLKS